MFKAIKEKKQNAQETFDSRTHRSESRNTQ